MPEQAAHRVMTSRMHAIPQGPRQETAAEDSAPGTELGFMLLPVLLQPLRQLLLLLQCHVQLVLQLRGLLQVLLVQAHSLHLLAHLLHLGLLQTPHTLMKSTCIDDALTVRVQNAGYDGM